jgi:hypothetical protein
LRIVVAAGRAMGADGRPLRRRRPVHSADERGGLSDLGRAQRHGDGHRAGARRPGRDDVGGRAACCGWASRKTARCISSTFWRSRR